MPQLTVADLRRQIASGRLGPLYLILGSDEAGKDRLASEFVDLIEPDLRAFNVDRLYGGETNVQTLVDAARTLPLMAPRRIVLLLHAERLLIPKREGEAARTELEAIERYINGPVESSTMVFVAGDLDERRRIVKVLRSAAAVVRCEGPADAGEAARWIREQAAQQGMNIEPAAARVLADRATSVVDRRRVVDVGRLRADLDRLLLYAVGSKTITLADANEVVGDPTAQDVWAVTRAIERGAAGEALRELALLLEAGTAPLAILGPLAWFVRAKLPAARLAPAVEAVFRTDLLLKTSTGDPRAMLERLVVELCGG